MLSVCWMDENGCKEGAYLVWKQLNRKQQSYSLWLDVLACPAVVTTAHNTIYNPEIFRRLS